VKRILVIKLAALGDFVQAFGPFAAIRAHHPESHITLLTTPPYVDLAQHSPWFDEIWADGRPRWHDVGAVWRLASRLGGAKFDRVYDLQTSGRSSRYRWFTGSGPEWSGIALGASHRHGNPKRDFMHTLDRQREQLETAGITAFPTPDLTWLDADLSKFALPPRFCLLVPGASPTRPAKRWPAERYAELAARIPFPAIVVGSPVEAEIASYICKEAANALDFTGLTNLKDIAALARRAIFCIGNDTGPTHLVAACMCPTLVLFSHDSDPSRCAPRTDRVTLIQKPDLRQLTTAEVFGDLERLLSDLTSSGLNDSLKGA